ncbi:substrate-binding domain-containing protein [Uliginosibacterium gangwonense]|uniref:substrate-binding domain-containing protein n=1 Tax=Uliginosibacterium gangwonense TaxID=392736 RepID=UPI0003808480|nr:substrate-binding domain-containing protein [Uliginosibacterium gangwonense]
MNHFFKRRTLLLGGAAGLAQAVLGGCSRKGPPTIGLMLDNMSIERWLRDRDYFVEAAKKIGVEVAVKWANGDENGQVKQFLELVDRKVDAIVVLPLNGKLFKDAVAKAKAASIKVVAYDRIIFDADIDAYISVDNAEIGRMQVNSVIKAAPKGNYFLLGGANTDGNALVYREEHLKALQPLVDKGDVKIVGMEWVTDWDPAVASDIMIQVFEKHLQIDAVVASNDGTAGGVIEVLKTRALAGKVPVSGQDCDLDACKRVLKGTQTMTVYKHLKDLATLAADTTLALVSGKEVKYEGQLPNGFKKVDTKLLKPTLITKENMDLLVKEGMYTREQLGI